MKIATLTAAGAIDEVEVDDGAVELVTASGEHLTLRRIGGTLDGERVSVFVFVPAHLDLDLDLVDTLDVVARLAVANNHHGVVRLPG